MMDTDLTDENYDLANAEAEGDAIRREMAEEMGAHFDVDGDLMPQPWDDEYADQFSDSAADDYYAEAFQEGDFW